MKEDIPDFNFNQIYQAYYKLLVAFANKYLKNLDDSEELVQLFFTDLLEKMDELNIKNIKSYLYQSIYNRCLNHLKLKSKHSTKISVDYMDSSYNIESSIEATEFEYQVFQLINKLPKACKEIFMLSRFEGYSNDDIAKQKGLSKRTIETQISNALKQLRKEIKALNASEATIIKLNSFFF